VLKLLRNQLVNIICCAVVLGLCASCSKPLPPAPAVSEMIFSGDIKQMETVPGRGDTIAQVKDGDVSAVVLSSQGIKREPYGDGDSGIARLTPDLSNSLSGRTVTVKITLRKAPTNGSPLAKAMYSRPGIATSGWKDVPAGDAFSVATFDYLVPTDPGPRGPDLVSVWADPENQGRAIEIRSVEISASAQP
jgi:hypothetical protein